MSLRRLAESAPIPGPISRIGAPSASRSALFAILLKIAGLMRKFCPHFLRKLNPRSESRARICSFDE